MLNFETLFRRVPVACAILDQNKNFVAVNDTYIATLGRSREELIGRCVFDLFPETAERQRLIEDSFDRALAGEANSLDNIAYSIPVGDSGRMHEIWWKVSSAPLPDAGGDGPLFALLVEDVTLEVRAQEMSNAIARELQHRVKNIFSLSIGLARLTAKSQNNVDGFIEAYTDRLTALSRAHDMLTGDDWDGMKMRPLLMRHLEMYADRIDVQIFLSGPDMKISAEQAQAVSMGVHELSTNAAKHGALASDAGRIDISWDRVGEAGFQFAWRETGLEGVTTPERAGFGSTILLQILPRQLGGVCEIEYAPGGLRYSVTAEDEQR